MPETLRFLLIYDHRLRRLVGTPKIFKGEDDAIAAMDAYDIAEKQYAAEQERYEVLLVGAESLETVRQTHGRFFQGTNEALDSITAGA